MGHCRFISLLLAVLAGLEVLVGSSGGGGFFWCRAAAAATTTTTDVERSRHEDAERGAAQDDNSNDKVSSCPWTDDDSDDKLNSCAAQSFAVAWSDEKIAETARFWNLHESQITALRTLGQRLVDLNYNRNQPSYVIRFLLQRKVMSTRRNSCSASRCSGAWTIMSDTILQTFHPPPELLDVFPSAVIRGLDKDGDPIVVTRDGSLDSPGLYQRFGLQTMVQFSIWHREMVWSGNWTRHYELQQGRPVRQLLIIDDMHGVQIKHIFDRRLVECFAQVVRLDKENYPHSVKKFVIVRVPRIFETIWSIVKHMLDPVAVEKVVFSSPKNYVKDLAELVDLKYLPEEIVPGIGRGEAREGFPQSFQANSVPLI